jgi:hypothetical protein
MAGFRHKLRNVTKIVTNREERVRSKRCPVCKNVFKPRTRGRPPRYCSAACRQKRYRKQLAHVPLKLIQNDLQRMRHRQGRIIAAWKVLEDAGLIERGHLPRRPKPKMVLISPPSPETETD